MKKITFNFLICLLALYSCGTYPNLNTPSNSVGDMPNEPGKCYAKCLTPDITEEQTMEFNVYTGSDAQILEQYVKNEVIEIAPASTKWVKKKAERNCLSADPNDCLVWCLVEQPAQTITIENMLMDSTVTKEFETETHNIDFVKVSGGNQVWMTVVCNPNELLVREVQQALNDEGYDLSVEMIHGKFGTASKKALIAYQKDYGLHIGGLTEESLEALGVEY